MDGRQPGPPREPGLVGPGRGDQPESSRTVPIRRGQIRNLVQHGGIWADADFVCQRPFDALIGSPFAGQETRQWLNNALIGAPAGSDMLLELIARLPNVVENVAAEPGEHGQIRTPILHPDRTTAQDHRISATVLLPVPLARTRPRRERLPGLVCGAPLAEPAREAGETVCNRLNSPASSPEEVGETLAKYAALANYPIVEIGSLQGEVDLLPRLRHRADGVRGRPVGSGRERERTVRVRPGVHAQRSTSRRSPTRTSSRFKGSRAKSRRRGTTGRSASSTSTVTIPNRPSTTTCSPGVPTCPLDAVVILDDLDTPKNPGVRRAAERLRRMLGDFTVEADRLAVWRL